MIIKVFLWIKKVISEADTPSLIVMPFILGFVVMIIGYVIKPNKEWTGSFIDNFIAMTTLFIWGFSGLFVILRKEAPWNLIPFERKGLGAIFYGVIMLLGSWGILIWVLISIIQKALQ